MLSQIQILEYFENRKMRLSTRRWGFKFVCNWGFAIVIGKKINYSDPVG